MMIIKRGEVWLANLDAAIGSGARKAHPVVIVSNDTNNMHNNTVTVLPVISSAGKVFSFEVLLPKGIGNLSKDAKAKADQVRTVDKSRIIKLIGAIPLQYVASMDEALKLHLGLY